MLMIKAAIVTGNVGVFESGEEMDLALEGLQAFLPALCRQVAQADPLDGHLPPIFVYSLVNRAIPAFAQKVHKTVLFECVARWNNHLYLFLVASRRSTEHKTYSMWSRDALFTMQRKSPDEMLYSLTNRGHITGSMSYKRVYEPTARRQGKRRW